ncbi:MBL fold metallo-hydrolase [Alteromonas sp. CYL-A6]|uniref:MBL fold metallo-hydrolase n=1 Tax=Alteromonas nitratireducens TaxID=3390813 RepID=UPI0034C18E21
MKLHKIKGYIQFIYLIEQAHGLMLLDGCSRADVDRVCTFINELGRDVSELKWIVVTHMHPDHAGGAHALRKRSGAKILAHPKAPLWYRGAMGWLAHVIDIVLTWWVAGRLGKPKKYIWYPRVLKPDHLAEDGGMIPGFEEFVTAYTPGHTDHDLSVIHVPSGQVYVADLFVRVKGKLAPPYPVCHPNQYKQSLSRIANSAPSKIYSAHVPPLTPEKVDFDALLAQAPTLPKNLWHSTRNRVRHTFGLSKPEEH